MIICRSNLICIFSIICIVISLFAHFDYCNGHAVDKDNLYTALPDLELLLKNELTTVKILDAFLDQEIQRIEILKKLSKEYAKTVKHGFADITSPIASYVLMKDLLEKWSKLDELVRNNGPVTSFLANVTDSRESTGGKFVNHTDLDGAAFALLRLQDVYDLKVHDMAKGRITSLPNVPQTYLSAADCFHVGHLAASGADFYHALMWLSEALQLTDTEKMPTVDKKQILGQLQYTMYQQGNIRKAAELTKQLMMLDPKNEQARASLDYYEYVIKHNVTTNSLAEPNMNWDEEKIVNKRILDASVQKLQTYEQLCRAEIKQSPAEQRSLYCYYKMDRPFLRLAPIKAELVKRKPKFILFRNVISDREINVIKESINNQLQNAKVGRDDDTKKSVVREAKSGWLVHEDELNVILSNRISDMTNLNGYYSERLHIVKYNIGGHYSPHYDYFNSDPHAPPEKRFVNDRIATVIFYLVAPDAGGATAFPEIDLALFPSQNDAIFWHNLYKSGSVDPNTRHGACPILSGSKWIANKWIREHGQEFYRRCALNEDEYE